MKRLSEETQSLIYQLYPKNKSWIKRLFSSTPDHTSTIEKIATSNEPSAIIQIAPLIFSSDKKTQAKLAEAIARLLKGLSQQDYVNLDQQMRSSYYYYSLRLEPKDVANLEDFCSYNWVPLAIGSMSGNGYVREKSCLLLGNAKFSEAIPFLLLRANDWVDQVRATAIKAISSYLSPAFTNQLIESLYLISRLEHSRSKDAGQIKKQTFRVLLENSSKNELTAALSHQDSFVKRTCYELSLSSPHCDTIEILRRGFSDKDVVVRLFCCQKLKQLPKDKTTLELVQAGIKDPFMPVKREAISILSGFDHSVAKQALHDNLCDRSASIRQMCRNLIKLLEPDMSSQFFKDYYLEQLNSRDSKNVDGALAGLGEVGEISCCKVIETFLNHRYARVRKAAIRAIFKLNPEDYNETFYHHMITDSGSVAKEAALAISLTKSFVSSEKLLSLFSHAENPNTKLIVLWLVNYSLGKWEKIVTLLKACNVNEETVFQRCITYLGMWVQNFNKGSTSTSNENLKSARDALSDVRHRLDPKFCKTLDFYLKDI